jgi:hypothetical protein
MGLFDLAEIRLADLEVRVAALEGILTVNAVTDYALWEDAHGAHTDGVTETHDHLQNAMDYVSAQGGGIVYLPAGTYYINGNHINFPASWASGGCIAIRNKVHLQGAGIGVSTIKGGTQTGMNTVCASSWIAGSYSVVRDIEMSDLTIEGSGEHADCCKLYAVSGAHIHDVEFKDSVYSGMNIIDSNDVLVEDCVAHGHPVYGIAAQQTSLDYKTPDGTYAQDIEFRNCEAYDCSYGFEAQGNTTFGNISNITWWNLYAHDNDSADMYGKNLWLWRVTGFTAIDCEAFRASTTSYNFFVDTCTNGAISHTGYKTPGGTAAVIQSCANVSETGAYLSTREE